MKESFSLLFLVFALLAEIVGTVGGFGSSVYFVPIANFYFDFETVLGLTALFHVSSNISKIALFRKGLDKRLVIMLGVPALIFVIIGGILAKHIDGDYLSFALGVFLVSLSLIFLLWKDLKIKDGNTEAVIGGTLSGFFAGFLGTGGAVRGLTMAAFHLEKSAFIATSAVIDFGVDLTRSVVYFYNGFIKEEVLIYLPFLLFIGWFGTFIGKKVLAHMPQKVFRKLSLITILLIGCITIYHSTL